MAVVFSTFVVAAGRKGWPCTGLRALVLAGFAARWNDPEDVAVCLVYFPPLKLP